MNEHELLKKLAGAARWDSPPPIDVTMGVLWNISVARRPKPFDPVLGYFAAVATVAAVVVAAAAIHAWLATDDSLLAMINSITSVI